MNFSLIFRKDKQRADKLAILMMVNLSFIKLVNSDFCGVDFNIFGKKRGKIDGEDLKVGKIH